ncbi:hypothetical protein HPP92_006852 [Vanilla planifolia]|uniref:Kinesin motor domain-containing protein n=1 Tax=Vanilla planifolia TaxID=51239 RepID=A0A835RF84_VANPL|nr:hypothetical protein HPP92_006852 [Vanilla planifolia]
MEEEDAKQLSGQDEETDRAHDRLAAAGLEDSDVEDDMVCIFAYGQTGSEAPEQKGLIPRSLEQIFETSQSLQCQGWTYKIQASMLEIYNETIRDLLSPNRSTSSCLTLLNKQYTIKHDSAGHGTTGSRCFEPDRSCRK